MKMDDRYHWSELSGLQEQQLLHLYWWWWWWGCMYFQCAIKRYQLAGHIQNITKAMTSQADFKARMKVWYTAIIAEMKGSSSLIEQNRNQVVVFRKCPCRQTRHVVCKGLSVCVAEQQQKHVTGEWYSWYNFISTQQARSMKAGSKVYMHMQAVVWTKTWVAT